MPKLNDVCRVRQAAGCGGHASRGLAISSVLRKAGQEGRAGQSEAK